MNKQSKFAKKLALFNWILIAVLLVVNIFTYATLGSVTDKISANPDAFPEGFSLSMGLGLVIVLVYFWILHGIIIALTVPTAIFKNKSAKAGKTVVPDIVFTILTAVATLPAIYIACLYFDLLIDACTYGIGGVLIPMAVAIVAQVVLAILNVVHLFVGKNKKTKENQQEEIVNS